MKRNLGFDIARVISMFYIIGVLHLSGYTGISVANYDTCVSFIWSTLGVFTFLSAYLLASKYNFSSKQDIIKFYKKRLLRFYPLFFISSIALIAIKFNTWDETWKGLLGISPFWEPQQQTLWYIATLMFLYLITPILCTNSLIHKILKAILILCATLLIDMSFHSVDSRFYYYFVIYTSGIIIAKHFSTIGIRILQSGWTLAAGIPYIILLLTIYQNGNQIFMLGAGYLGIIVILNITMLFSKAIENQKRLCKIIHFVSYGSMCAYLFHREVYWFFLELWSPTEPITIWAYLFLIAFPITLLVSYYIQKRYDKIFS